MEKVKELSKEEMKRVIGGFMEVGPCDSCKRLCHQDDNGDYDFDMCSPETGGTSCHNYCCEAGQSTYWC